MSKELVRAHVAVRRELVEEVDKLVGSRSRSKFVEEAVEEKLARLRLADVARRAAGSLKNVPIAGWETSESAAEWVSASRRADDERLSRHAEGE